MASTSPNGVEYLDVDEARQRSGVRLVLTVGVPGPWGEAAKGLLHAKGIAFERVRQDPGTPNEALREWTGISNAPQLICNDEEPLHAWADLVFCAERLRPEPSLIPRAPAERALMFGLIREIAGEQGLGWSRRLSLFHPLLSTPGARENPALAVVVRMADRYRYSVEAAEAAPTRIAELLELLGARFAEQRASGSRYLVGDSLSALDIYWATFAAMFAPLPPELCPMQDFIRAQYTSEDPGVLRALGAGLLEHRDFIYREHLELPVRT
jgi:glutathione S-transferase